MDHKAAKLVAAIERATRNRLTDKPPKREAPPLDPTKPWGAHCSAMFRETMRQLTSRGVAVKYKDENANANELGLRIIHSPHDWTEVKLDQVQSLANEGIPVVGV